MLTLHQRAVRTATTGWLLFPAEMGAIMVCPEKTRLQDVFAAEIDRHAKTVKALRNAIGPAFDKALNEASSSRQEAEIARLSVEEHRATHGC